MLDKTNVDYYNLLSRALETWELVEDNEYYILKNGTIYIDITKGFSTVSFFSPANYYTPAHRLVFNTNNIEGIRQKVLERLRVQEEKAKDKLVTSFWDTVEEIENATHS